jgi:hypothetical protein
MTDVLILGTGPVAQALAAGLDRHDRTAQLCPAGLPYAQDADTVSVTLAEAELRAAFLVLCADGAAPLRDGRVYRCDDEPAAGLLAWQLAALLGGWGGEAMRAAYAVEQSGARSPLIAQDAGPDTPTAPGRALPEVALHAGRSLHAELGRGFTLICTDPTIATAPLQAQAGIRSVPLTVLDISPDRLGAAFAEKLVLVRPDRIIAWRGDTLPANPAALIDLIRGATVKSD